MRAQYIKEAILENCFWFGKYFWWRHTTLSDCCSTSLTTGSFLDFVELLNVVKLDVQLGTDYNLVTYCNLDRWGYLVPDGQLIFPSDPYYFERPPFCYSYDPPGPQTTFCQWEPDNTSLWLILDTNNPLFKPITQIACYFYPITDSCTPYVSDMADVYSEYYKPLNSTEQYIVQILKNSRAKPSTTHHILFCIAWQSKA